MASSAYRALLEHELSREARSIVSILTLMISDAQVLDASDIHIDPAQSHSLVRLRIDGLLTEAYTLPSSSHAELISRLKILSRLRTDEHFSPQDGGFKFVHPNEGKDFDIRIAIMPTQYGESAVLRLLIPPINDSLEDLGMTIDQTRSVGRMLESSHGMVLIVGPTGSGKTTTLYTFLRQLDTGRSVVTIEDPIEYSVPGLRQIQVMPQQGLTFAQGLRAVLRQDPDVIVIGEIRDAETANLAVNAAHTGHLVLSTLHATSVAGAFARLEELGVTVGRISTIRLLIVSQQLVRSSADARRHAEFDCSYA